MRLGQILDFICIYPLESHFYGFVKQSKVLIDRKKKYWFNSEGTIYLPIFRKARPFFFICKTLKKKGRAFRNIGKYIVPSLLNQYFFFLSIYIYIAD